MDNSLVYRKSGLGAAQLSADHGRALSPRERQVLVLVNGQRTIADLSDLFGADTIQRLIPDLEAKGFAKRVEPKIGAESGGTVTQLHVASLPRARPSKPARDLRARRYPIVWIGLSLALALSFAAWTAHRFSNQAGAISRSDGVPVQPQPIMGLVEPAPTVASDQNPLQQSAPVPVSAVAVPAASALKGVADSPARAAQPVAPSPPEAVEATAPTVSAAALAAMDAPTPVPSADAPMPVPRADAPDSTPSVDGPGSTPSVDASPANPQAAVAETKVAAQNPPPQAPGDQVSLRPLRHDPPRIPPKALLDGIAEGHARARLWVTAEGKVDQVDIIEATPHGVLDDEIRRALSLWTYDPPGRSAEDTVELTLKP